MNLCVYVCVCVFGETSLRFFKKKKKKDENLKSLFPRVSVGKICWDVVGRLVQVHRQRKTPNPPREPPEREASLA